MSRARPPQRSGDEEMSEGEPGQQAYGLGRILALSDGVFAFSLTLLVVSLSVPTATNNSALASQLLDQAPTYYSYIISFVAVASIWYGHHESFKYIRRYDGRLIALNFGSLLLIAFLPFPTAVLGRNQQESLAAVLYALTLAVSNLFFAATWWHASHGRRLVRSDLSPDVVRLRFYRTLGGTLVFLLSIPIALWRPIAAEIIWSVFLVAIYVVLRGAPQSRHERDRQRAR
ncbi:MAG TPA: TMEM175 family protein [Candidatus Dormibacteraeota bacterium]|nr:TMEM175 family protein [Candidatus Dormibacteraeota bacterium]